MGLIIETEIFQVVGKHKKKLMWDVYHSLFIQIIAFFENCKILINIRIIVEFFIPQYMLI